MRPILFLDDWKKHPGAIIHYTTKNKTFLDLALKLKRQGVKNHFFMLALLDPTLENVDPHSEDLTEIEEAKILIECKRNPWYFFREVAKAPGRAGSKNLPFKANRGNISLFWIFFNHIRYCLIQPRQTGKSFSVDTLMVYLMNIACTDTSIAMLTKDDKLRKENLERLKSIIDALPVFLNMFRNNDTSNTEEFYIGLLGNKYIGYVPRADKVGANNVSRGSSPTIFQFDEPPFCKNIDITFPAAVAAMGAAVDAAKAMDAPYGIILTTTAGKLDEASGLFIHNMISDGAVWNEIYYDAESHDELILIINTNSYSNTKRYKIPLINGTFSHRQLGYSDEWLLEKMEGSNGTPDDKERDFLNVWTSGSIRSPFKPEVANRMRESRKDPLWMERFPGTPYLIRWYVDEFELIRRMETGQICFGLDGSDAIGGDDISLVFTDMETGEVLGAGDYNETNILNFGMWLVKVMVKYYRTIAIIESKSSGRAIIDILLAQLPQHGIDPFKRIYNRIVQEANENPRRFEEIKHPNRRAHNVLDMTKRYFGFATSASGLASRSELYSTILQYGADMVGDKLHDQKLIDETLALEMRNGRVDHPPGGHDDMSISWLLCMWFMNRGLNHGYYGLDSNLFMRKAQKVVEYSQEEIFILREQESIKNQMNELYELMNNEPDDNVCARYEQQLRVMSNRLIVEENSSFSIDDVIRQANEERKRIKRSNRYAQSNFR